VEGVQLLRDADDSGRYLTIDRWTEQAAFDRFQAEFGDRYRDLDRELTELARSVKERCFGRARLGTALPWFPFRRSAEFMPAPADQVRKRASLVRVASCLRRQERASWARRDAESRVPINTRDA
jgi:hypothetical protein